MRFIPVIEITIKELLRKKIIFGMVIINLIYLFLSYTIVNYYYPLGKLLTMQIDGSKPILLLSSLFAIFINMDIISKEVENKSIYFTLTKPINRTDIMLGKFVGSIILLVLNMFIMSSIFVIQIYLISKSFIFSIFLNTLLISLVPITVASITILFSSIFSSSVAGIISFVILNIGGYFSELQMYIEEKIGLGEIAYIIPPVNKTMNVTFSYIQNNTLEIFDLLPIVIYTFATLILAILIFNRKDL